MSWISIFDNLLVDAFTVLIIIFILVYVTWTIFVKIFPNWRDWFENKGDVK